MHGKPVHDEGPSFGGAGAALSSGNRTRHSDAEALDFGDDFPHAEAIRISF
jgi:hypothetical protein